MRSLTYALVLTVCNVLAACEYGPPAVANAFAQPATFRVSFAEGAPFQGTLQQGAILWQPQKGRHITSVTITAANGAQHEFSQSVLQRLREERHVRDELWIFSTHGIRLEDTHDTERIRKELPTPPKA